MSRTPVALFFACALSAACASCARAPLKDPHEAMRPTTAPVLTDDLPLGTLLDAVAVQLAQFEAAMPPRPSTPAVLRFGPREVAREDYIAGLRRFGALGRQYPVARFVLDQDTGGAIAGVMKQKGALYYLVPKAKR
jgi:hypothetical protein